jgi:tRNA 2-thiouridine synthesizing protein A
MEEFPKPDKVLDLRGLTCPAPILKTKRAVDRLEAGQVIEVWGTDPGTKSDMPAWARQAGHEFLGYKDGGDFTKFYIRKGGQP